VPDIDALAASSGIALALSVAANVALWRAFMKRLDHDERKDSVLIELSGAVREMLRYVERGK
jgi:hypothetical protein